ncbi:unnamed protein product [Nippostrongylus brasiliensis]|uniref:Uncharacterized protein n=1 Tax=Nippostrongylus brasiliensis TaxID=27835 RepID=A0A0N4Y7A9_NIPBR|nr:unnamed protein product [Nippostrongylus brasiliensis]
MRSGAPTFLNFMAILGCLHSAKCVLRFFLQIPNIYATKELRADLEARARKNIENEIRLLETGARTY